MTSMVKPSSSKKSELLKITIRVMTILISFFNLFAVKIQIYLIPSNKYVFYQNTTLSPLRKALHTPKFPKGTF